MRRIDETQPRCCSVCGEIKSPEEFSRGKKRNDDSYVKRAACKICSSKAEHIYRKANAEACKARGRKSYIARKRDLAYKMKTKLEKSKQEAKRLGHVACNATVEELLFAFQGVCEVCGVPEVECNGSLCMDHNRRTGSFRGFLCRQCNAAAGMLKDSPSVIHNLAEYIEQAERKEYGPQETNEDRLSAWGLRS